MEIAQLTRKWALSDLIIKKNKIRNRLDKTLLLVSPESAATKWWETFLMWRVP